MLTLSHQVLSAGGHPLLSEVPANLRLFRPVPGMIDAAFFRLRFDQPTDYAVCPLGRLHGQRYLALHRYEPFWMKPAAGTDAAAIPMETQALFVELPGNQIALLIPLVPPREPQTASAMRCSLRGAPGGLELIAETGSPAVRQAEAMGLLIALGEELSELTRRAAQILADYLGVPLREQKHLPTFIDSFGWCTWDAFYQEVSHDKVREGLEAFRAAEISPPLLIIDDGWQSTKDFGEEKGKRLTSFAPNAKFHHDLTATTRMAKEEFGVRQILAWHALQGYWGGLEPQDFPQLPITETARDYSPGILHYWPEANTRWWGASAGIVDPASAYASFFMQLHAQLRSQGIDGVKVDNQGALEAFVKKFGRVHLYRAYQQAIEMSCGAAFAPDATGVPADVPAGAIRGNLLHCMSCANDLLYTSRLPLTRTSTDFWPDKPETHGLHLWTNAAVATWFGHFVHPDWDMFQSAHPFAEFHAAARAISGGPLYVSDKPGRHDAALLRRLMGSDGTILRADRPAMLTRDGLLSDPISGPALLKVWNTLRQGTTGLVGLFNCHHDPSPRVDAPGEPGSLWARVGPGDVPLLPKSARYLLHVQGPGPRVTRLIGGDETVEIALLPSEHALVTLIPVPDATVPVGLGILQKFLPAAAIVAEMRTPTSLELQLRTNVHWTGETAAVWLPSTLARGGLRAAINGQTAAFSVEAGLLQVELPAAVGGSVVVRVSW
jgi:raffinose synthase